MSMVRKPQPSLINELVHRGVLGTQCCLQTTQVLKFPLNTILAWNINFIMNKNYNNNIFIIASRAYFQQKRPAPTRVDGERRPTPTQPHTPQGPAADRGLFAGVRREQPTTVLHPDGQTRGRTS